MEEFDVTKELLKKGKTKKKKKYILYLEAPGNPSIDSKTCERMITSQLNSDFVYLRMTQPEDALRMILIRNIALVIIHQNFLNTQEMNITYGLEIKKRKRIPILFSTENENELILKYNENMEIYEEQDDYIISPIEFVELGKKIKKQLQNTTRTAKRFPVECPIEVFSLNQNQWIQASLVDLSIIGCGIRLKDHFNILKGDQLRIKINLGFFNIFHHEYGDYFKISAKIQRLSINGETLGCSLEFLTSKQQDVLILLLREFARKLRLQKRKTNEEPSTPIFDISEKLTHLQNMGKVA